MSSPPSVTVQDQGRDTPEDVRQRKLANLPTAYLLSFDGIRSRLRIDKSQFKYFCQHPLTIEAVVIPSRADREMRVLSDMSGSAGFQLGINADGKWSVSYLSGQTVIEAVDSRKAPIRKTHVAAVFDTARSELRLYVDGTCRSRTPMAAAMAKSPWDLIIGGDPNHPQPNTIVCLFEGQIEQLRFSKIARYGNRFQPPVVLDSGTDIMAVFHFNEGAGGSAYDSSGNGLRAAIEFAGWVKRASY